MDRRDDLLVSRRAGVALRVARRHAYSVRNVRAVHDGARDDDDDTLTRCSDACSVTSGDVERLLGHAGVAVDAGSVRFDEHGYGEVEVRFAATRTDGRPMTGVLVVRLRADRDGGAVQTYAEVGPIW